MSYTPEEIEFLTVGTFDHPELTLSRKTQIADIAALRAQYGEFARAVAELLCARRSGKFPGGAQTRWLADSDSAQQATPLAVSAYRAAHLRGLGVDIVHDVTCSVGTEGHALRAAGITYLGSDLDSARLRMARHNVPDGWFVRADALAPVSTLPTGGVVLADPARRAGGRRITDPAKLLPPLPDLLAAHAGRELAVKCAPGLNFCEWEGVVEVASVDGAVKEACLYTPGLGDAAVTRRAVLLSADGSCDVIANAGRAPDVAAGAPGRFILDPDGAIVRAGLVRHYAAREGLWQLDPHIAYLTGDRLPAGRSGFEFIEAVPLKKLKAALAAHGCGSLEILVRGVDVDPDQLRTKLKLKGKRPMAVVLARIGSGPVAHICEPRVSSTED
ncbi:SAM-dependent methyltransferase [uncultured Corynebacterium sp.]|mgnify:CR=1 FL=1|uniref:THUMP-like domain-containing protein n=1 Tax=uncultured Corynebacterium sp. TaxID=159447 RepID=UPI0025CBD7E7|nr:SAM-dependent methyltransferase [uncultured Corynebacterium sp.]